METAELDAAAVRHQRSWGSSKRARSSEISRRVSLPDGCNVSDITLNGDAAGIADASHCPRMRRGLQMRQCGDDMPGDFLYGEAAGHCDSAVAPGGATVAAMLSMGADRFSTRDLEEGMQRKVASEQAVFSRAWLPEFREVHILKSTKYSGCIEQMD